MAIKQLTEEQVREWTLEQKDKWWLENVYKGNMRQLTVRSAFTGAILGAVLSLTNLYIGIRTGWTLGVGITSVVLSYGIFKLLSRLGLGDEMTILENNAMQSIATSAGYMTMPLVSAIPAYMMVTGHIIPQWQVYCWMVALSILGVLFAFPLKKKYINDEQLPFPEGYAAGVVMESLHESEGSAGMIKVKLLGMGAFVAAIIEFLRSETVLSKIGLKFMALPHAWDDLIYKFATPTLLGTPLKELTIRLDTSIVMMGTGMLMSLRTCMSLLLGGILNYWILAPIMINNGIIEGTGFKNISVWGLWGGAAMMTTAAIYSFLFSPSTIAGLKDLVNVNGEKKKKKEDVLKDIELPNRIAFIGIFIIGVIIVLMAKSFFDIDYWLSAIAIPLVFCFCIMAVKSTGLTAVTPGSALGKLTQVTYAVLAPGQLGLNIMTAGICSEVASNASNLLMDIKPGYMLGGKPRHQAVGHLIGIFVGGMAAIPVFYLLFDGDLSVFSTEKFPMPSATVWKAVADVLSNGLSALHPTAQIAVLIGAVAGVVMEILIQRSKGKFPITPIGFGLAFVLQFSDILMFFLGSLIFWLMEKKPQAKRSATYQRLVENKENIGAGIIAGGALVGIALLIAETTM